jgi:Flp pilus assembly protein TadG
MMEWIRLNRCPTTLAPRLHSEDCAAQIVELAVSLPVLVVFVVGIFDFSGAFTLKQKLTNAARDGARVAAAAPANDVGNPSNPVPTSVDLAFRVVGNYLEAVNINDCGLTPSTSPTHSSSTLTWTYTATGGGCPTGGLTIAINRGYVFPPTGASSPTGCTSQPSTGSTVNVVGTCVSITYAYKWRFNSVITLLVPGATYAGVSNLNTTAVAFNEN